MILSKELLEKRIEVLTAQKAQVIANVNAIEGGIMILRSLLSDLNREEKDESGGPEIAGPPVEE
ncbi:hypothetical protein KKE60_07900 [Patescibacteria group bacterium]|nr:hypothetical protein [Patescibacteria group bacterium]